MQPFTVAHLQIMYDVDARLSLRVFFFNNAAIKKRIIGVRVSIANRSSSIARHRGLCQNALVRARAADTVIEVETVVGAFSRSTAVRSTCVFSTIVNAIAVARRTARKT